MPTSVASRLGDSATPPRQAVIMAAGLGLRMRPLTDTLPKPMLAVSGQPILERSILALPSSVEEIVIVVGYLKDKIINHFGAAWRGRRVVYVEQTELKGSGHALFACRDRLDSRFFVLNGDDLYDAVDLAELARHDLAILAKEMTEPGRFGAFRTDAAGRLLDIVEGGETRPGALVNAGAYLLDPGIFDYPLVPIRDGKEFGLPQTVAVMAKDRPVHIARASFWVPIGFPEDIAKAEAALAARQS